MSPATFYVYFIECLDGRVYVGFTANPHKRWLTHIRTLQSNTHINILLQRIFDKYGEAFLEFKIFREYTSEQEARDGEEYWINYFLDNAPDLCINISRGSSGGDNLTNHPNREEIIARMTATIHKKVESLTVDERRKTWGRSGELNGMYGKTHTPEVRQLLSEKNKGHSRNLGIKRSKETRAKLSEIAKARTGEKNPFFGKHHTDEFKKKMSEARKGKLPVNSIKISCEGITFESLASAARYFNISSAAVAFRLKSKYFPTYFKILQEMPNDHPEKE